MSFLDEYEMVKDRLPIFYDYFPDGRIITEIVSESDRHVTIKASIYADKDELANGTPLATGIAREVAGGRIEKYTENCETSSIGRALANRIIYGEVGTTTGNRPSAEEMASVNTEEKPQTEEDPQAEENAFVQSQAPVGNYDSGEIASAAAFGETPQITPPSCGIHNVPMKLVSPKAGQSWEPFYSCSTGKDANGNYCGTPTIPASALSI